MFEINNIDKKNRQITRAIVVNTQSTQNTECEIFQLPEPEWRIHRIHIVHRIRNLPITRARVVNGVSSAGLTTQVQPAARAAATCFLYFQELGSK